MIAVKSGLGYMILNAQLTFRSDLIIAGIVVIGAIGLLVAVPLVVAVMVFIEQVYVGDILGGPIDDDGSPQGAIAFFTYRFVKLMSARPSLNVTPLGG